MKKILTILLVFAVAFASAQKATNKVKSKRGDLNLTEASGGGKTVCTATFSDEMTIIKQQDSYTLVKGPCQGWVSSADIEKVVQGPGDKGMKIETVDISGWMDNPSAVFVLDQDAGSFEGINIDRNFNEYLKNTVDREQTEMRNQEN
jgi:hypothetical protein